MNEASHTLEEIRRTELEAAQRVEDARSQADEIRAGARARRRELVEEGRHKGRKTAQLRLERARAELEAETEAVRDRGVADAERLTRLAEAKLDPLVEALTALVLAPPREQGA